jgi:hybrid cluster-associated redox disulfide protein
LGKQFRLRSAASDEDQREEFVLGQRLELFLGQTFRKERQWPMPALDIDDPDLPIADIMRRWPETVTVFIAHDMLCVGCLVGPFHTIDDACAEYGLNPELMLAELRAVVTSAAAPEAQAGAAERR